MCQRSQGKDYKGQSLCSMQSINIQGKVKWMVYNTTFQPGDMPLIFQDLFGAFLQNGILYAGLIILVILFIVIIKSLKGR
jgi:hypothetical protein